MQNQNRKPMQSAALMAVALYLNGAAGSGKYDDITIQEVKDHIERKTIFQFLAERLGHDVDLTHLDEYDKKVLQEEWLDKALAVNEARKMCVDKGGLCLLVAYLIGQIREEAKEEGRREGRRV